MKRIISLLLSAVLLFGAFSTVLSAVECEHENTEWQQITDGCALVCTDCGEMLSDEQPHDFVLSGEYTDEEDCELWGCTGERYRGVQCMRCGCFGSEWIEPLGHDFVDGVCTRCGEAEPDCDHIWIYGSMTVPHDCLDTGHVVLMCDNCGTRKNVAVHGVNHHYENGVCAVCGAEKPEASSDVEFDIELDRDAYDYGDYIDLDFKHNLTDEYWEDHCFLQYAEYIFDEDGNIVFENNGALYRNLSGAKLNVLTADTPSGRYTVELDVYVPDGNGGFTIIQSAEPFDFTEYNGALPYALEVYELERNRWGLDFGATLTSEEGLPVQNEYVDVTITRDGEVLREYSEATDGKGKLALQYYVGGSLSEGSYKITAVCSDRPDIKAEYEFEIIKKDPVINVTLDKDSYDYYNKVAYTVTLTNEEGTTDGLEWLFEYGDLWFEVELTDENGDVISYNGGDEINGYTGEGEFRLYLDEEYAGKLGVRITIWQEREYDGVAYFDYSGKQIDCDEHVWGDYVNRWDGHCRVCDLCGAESELEPHVEPEEWMTNEKGDGDLKCYYSFKECTVCGALLERTETVHPGGHFSEHIDENDPGCEYPGYYERYLSCDDCGEWVEALEWRRIPPLGHDFVDGVCTRCGVEADCIATLTLDRTEAGDGELIIATYTLTDVDGNPIPGVQVFFYTDFTGRNFDRTTDENGVAVFGFRPTLPHKDEDGYIYYGDEFGEHLLEAYTDEYRTSNAFAMFEFVEKDVTEEKYTVICEVSPDFIGDYSVTKDTVTYTVTVLDENGDPAHGVYVTFETWYGDVHLYSGLLITNDEGISLFKTGFTEDDETPAGTYTIVAKAGDASASDTFVFIHETEEDETPAGDCNGDGVINNKDVVVLFKYVSNSGAEYNRVYDFNGDGSVNNKDVVALFKYVSRT